MNEFGSIGLDGEEIQQGNLYDLVEIRSGCVCCMLQGRFVESFCHLLTSVEPERFFVEASGVADPAQVLNALQFPEIRDRIGCGILLISHDLHVVMAETDTVLCLNGHVCCQGRPEIVASAPEYRALFGSGSRGALALYRHDHDHDPVQYPLKYVNRRLNLATFSRLREINKDSSFSVIG